MVKKANIAIIVYSTYGHNLKMAAAIKEGVESSGHATGTIYRVAETLPKEVLAKMHAPELPEHPIATPDTLKNSDGFLLGLPTRFGMVPAQIKAFLDSTGALWASGALVGKPAGFFFSSNTQHGGQETTAMSALPWLAHQGALYVPLGYANPALSQTEEIIGGGPWGSGTICGSDGSRQPSAKELDVAKTQGKSFATIAAKLINAQL